MLPDAEAVAQRGAAFVAGRAREAVAQRGRFTIALSGGRTPWAMLNALGAEQVPWAQVALYQTDERAVPDGDSDRNLTSLLAALPESATAAALHPMPVTGDLDAGAAAYADELPERFDVVHLGLGADGHTASLVPGDAVLEIHDRPVAVTGAYQGLRRMTLTYPALDEAHEALWLVTGNDKRDALAQLLGRDESIPAARVRTPTQVVLADAAAAG